MTTAPTTTAQPIIAAVADFFSLSIEDLCGRRMGRALVYGRHIAMYLCRELTGLSLPQIGQAFGGRDHTTVLHADRKVRAALDHHDSLRDQVLRLSASITRPGPSSTDTATDEECHVPDPVPTRPATAPLRTAPGIRRAQLAVASAAHDSEDCRELLGMLGLLPHQLPKQRRAAARRTQPSSGGDRR